MAALDDLVTAIDTKLKTCSFITNSNNVVFGEEPDIMSLQDSDFPRMETLIIKCKCNGYADQRNLQWGFRVATAVFFKTTNNNMTATLSEMTTAMQYGKEVADKYFSFLDDSQAGNPPCDGFEQLGDYPEIFFEKELIPKTMATIIYTEIELLLADTETL